MALEGELKEARAEIKALKSKLEAQAELAQKERDRHKTKLRAAHAIIKMLEKKKFERIKKKEDQARSLEEKATEVARLTVELQFEKDRLSNGVFLKETFRNSHNFDRFAKDFSDVGFKLLKKGVTAIAPDLNLSDIKRKYVENWASGPHGTPGPQGLVDRYIREIYSDYKVDSKDTNDALGELQDKEVVASQDDG